MRYILATLAVSMLSLMGCVSSNPPSPVYGVDIKVVNQGEIAPFKGTLMSDFYLDRYLQWKDTK